ncbi:AAEL005876-PA, partial [Aedes aegypti]
MSSYGNVANARTTDWILQQNHAKYDRCRLTDLSNTRVKSSNLSSTVATPPIYRSLKSHSVSIKGHDKSLRKLISDSTGTEEMIDLDSIPSYCKENVVKASHQQYR